VLKKKKSIINNRKIFWNKDGGLRYAGKGTPDTPSE
jgi:hypothetical protein